MANLIPTPSREVRAPLKLLPQPLLSQARPPASSGRVTPVTFPFVMVQSWLPQGKEVPTLLPPCHQPTLNIKQVPSLPEPQSPRQTGSTDSRMEALPPLGRGPGVTRREALPCPNSVRGASRGGGGVMSSLAGSRAWEQRRLGVGSGRSWPRGLPPTPRPAPPPAARPAAREPRPCARRASHGGSRSSRGSRSLPGRPAAHGGAGSNLGRNGSGAEATAPRGPVPAAASLPAPPAGLIAESGLIGNANGN